MAIIAPSILAAKFGRLGDEVRSVRAAGADWIHIDVMDGHFVPPITFGPAAVRAAREACDAFLDVHLMIERPENQIAEFVKAGADLITVHQEACPHLHRVVQQIHEAGVKAGVAINPGTPVSTLTEIAPYIDLILIMTVNPGWGGQAYIESSDEKIRAARALLNGRPAHVEVDGGITAQTAGRVCAAGADVLVAGTAVFSAPDYAQAIAALRGPF